MSLKKYKWLVGSGIRKKGQIEELSDEDAKIRLILHHIELIKEQPKYVSEEKRINEEVRSFFKQFVIWDRAEKDRDAICFHKKDKKKVLKVLPDLLEKGYVIEDDLIKSIRADFITGTKLYFV